MKFKSTLITAALSAALLLTAGLTCAQSARAAAPDWLESAVEAEYPNTVKMRHYLHQHPELGNQEVQTQAYIADFLRAQGIKVIEGTKHAPTAVIGILNEGRGHAVGLRADIDALPIAEHTGLPYASTAKGMIFGKETAVSHMCGHDAHMAMLLSAAKIMAEHRDEIDRTVIFVFQPAEEGIGGARIIIDAGAVDDVESIVCLHGWPYLKVGEIGALGGKYMASADSFKVKMIGQGGHGCRPYKAVNPITAAAGAICALSNLPANEVVTAEQSVVSVCTVHGGSAFNVIPDTVEFGGTVRALDPQVRDQLEAGIRRIAAGAAEMYGCRAEVEYIRGVPPLINDPALVDEVLAAAEKALGKDAVQPLDGPVMGAEDFSLYIEKLKKGVFFRLGTAEENDSEPVALHNSHFDFNDEAIPYGIATMVQLVLDQHQ